jgi:hypothetical protein
MNMTVALAPGWMGAMVESDGKQALAGQPAGNDG